MYVNTCNYCFLIKLCHTANNDVMVSSDVPTTALALQNLSWFIYSYGVANPHAMQQPQHGLAADVFIINHPLVVNHHGPPYGLLILLAILVLSLTHICYLLNISLLFLNLASNIIDQTTPCSIATSLIHSKIDYCNSLLLNVPATETNQLVLNCSTLLLMLSPNLVSFYE